MTLLAPEQTALEWYQVWERSAFTELPYEGPLTSQPWWVKHDLIELAALDNWHAAQEAKKRTKGRITWQQQVPAL